MKGVQIIHKDNYNLFLINVNKVYLSKFEV